MTTQVFTKENFHVREILAELRGISKRKRQPCELLFCLAAVERWLEDLHDDHPPEGQHSMTEHQRGASLWTVR